MTDLMDAIDLLLHDHRTIGGLAEDLDRTDDPDEISRLYLRIVDELFAHEAAEQEVVFPAFGAALDRSGDRAVADRVGEHEEMNELLAEMRDLAPDAFAFTKRGSAFLLEVEAHFQREEELVFARMRASFAAAELVELGRRALAVKQRFLGVPDQEPGVGELG
jgi:hemerythrin superfamily protein